MHKIVKALELASGERTDRADSSGASEPWSIEPARRPSPLADPSLAPRGDGERLTRTVRIPPETLDRNRILTGASEDAATRAMKLLRTQVLRRLDAQGWRSIAVVSPSAAEGKTLTAINLSIAIGSSMRRTSLLVDLDWRHPSVHRHLEIVPEHDVVAYLDGKCLLSEVLVDPGIARFCIAPCRRPVANASERLGSPLLRQFHDELKSRYPERIVLFDLPPVLATDDALSFLPNVDSVLVVVEEGRTRRDDIVRLLELIDPTRLLGTVVNKSSSVLPEY